MRQFFLILLSLSLLTACLNEDDATVVAIHAVPSSNVVKSGDMFYIDVQVTTLNNTLTDVSISSFDSEHGKTEFYQIKPGTKSYKDRIVWEMPHMTSDTTIVEILISATDDAAVSNDFTLKIKAVGGGNELLSERSGFSIYSSFSEKPDAFSFTTLQPVISTTDADSSDIVLTATETEDGLSFSINSMTNVVFCRSNSFDYAAATWANVQSVFKSSLRTDLIKDIQIDDVIIVGKEIYTEDSFTLTALGAIKIMGIYDEAGSENDRIVFNLKTL
jgi:hypothetical protein